MPDLKNHDQHYSCTKKLKITNKGKEIFKDKFYFLTIECPVDHQITLTARSKVLDEKKKLAKIDKVVVGKEDINLKAHEKIKDSMTNKVQREYLIGHMNEILEA